MKHFCPICGHDRGNEPAYYEDGTATYDICICCGFQYGNTDDDKGFTHEQWRARWLKDGAKFNDGDSAPPPNWNPKKQLQNIGVFI